ncbi:hypothetical protein M8J77_004495 [Diaphorina citri]|nr:hypothetical protein M8J77_004495 [Diaphorina citri]
MLQEHVERFARRRLSNCPLIDDSARPHKPACVQQYLAEMKIQASDSPSPVRVVRLPDGRWVLPVRVDQLPDGLWVLLVRVVQLPDGLSVLPVRVAQLWALQPLVQNETFLLGCTYIPPSSGFEFYLDHCAVVEQLCLSLPDARVYLAGDYNLPTSVWSYDDECGLSVDCPLSSPAVQSELRKLTVEKKKAHAEFKRSNLQTDYIRFSVREKCKYLSGKCHKDHLHKVSESIKSNPKYFWRFSEETRKVNGMPKQMTLDGVTCSAPEDIANLYSCSFSSAYQEPREQVPVYPVKDCIDFNTCQFSSAEVFRALSSLPLKFSSGPDNIPSFILRKCASVLANPLSVIFNRSLSSGIFPEAWKLSFIIPIFKSGDRCNVGNYKGVCIQSAIPKVLDKLVSISLSAACKHFISDEQHGFTAKRSTVTNLLCYQHDIIDAFQSSSCVHSIYTDVSKAFDRVDTRLLIGKLKSYGIGDSFLSWLSSYFRDRTQSVLVGNSLSRPIPVLSGVGQGSHSGPLLFSLFFNDLPQVIRHSSVLMFADDVKLYKTIRTIGDCYLLQCDLDAFPSWLLINGEETSSTTVLTNDPTWIIDPIDGTLNFVHRFPHSCISVAFAVERELVIGIVYNPMLQQMFTAQKGKGAFLNGKRIHTSDTKGWYIDRHTYSKKDPTKTQM